MIPVTIVVSSYDVYVGNTFSSTVSVVSSVTGSVTRTFTGMTGVQSLCASPSGAVLYACDNVKVIGIDTSTGEMVGSLTVTTPTGICVTPDGSTLYVSGETTSEVSVISTSGFTLTTTVAVGTSPGGLAVTPDGSHVYVANSGSGTVSVIATATNTVVATVGVGNFPNGLTCSPDGSNVYVANSNSNTISVIATATNTVVATVGVGSNPGYATVTPDGLRVYVTNSNDNTISVIATTTNTVISVISVGSYPLPIAMSPLAIVLSSGVSSDDPNSFPNSVSAQVANSSGYALTIQSGGVVYVVAPYSVLTVPTVGGNPLVVSLSTTNVTGLGLVTLYWLTPHDHLPYPDGPLFAQGTAGALGKV